MQACTIVARNYLPQARVLAHSFRQHHPGCPFTVLLLDGDAAAAEVNDFSVLGLRDLAFESGEAERMSLIYNVLEFSTAVKPWLLQKLLRSGGDAVLYFDPDIEIFAPLADLVALARAHSIVLTPHVLKPMPRDDLHPTESTILGAGIYNLGFIAVGPGSESFLDWWKIRLRWDCIIDPSRMRFTDQRWVDFVPALFPHYILRDPTCNVAYWNLDQRQLSWTGGRYLIDGEPLRFFHFSGYDPDKPEVLSKFQGTAPRLALRREPAVARICDDYRGKLLDQGYERSKSEQYGYANFGGNLPLDLAIRRLYRTALLKSEAGERSQFLTLFSDPSGNALLDWLNEPLDSASALITRYMLALRDLRPDIQQAFPNPLGDDAAAFAAWVMSPDRDGPGTECPSAFIPVIDPTRVSELKAPRFQALREMKSVLGETINFGGTGNSERYRLGGWGRTERDFTWSVGGRAQMAVPVPAQTGPLALQVRLAAFVHPPICGRNESKSARRARKSRSGTLAVPNFFTLRFPRPRPPRAGCSFSTSARRRRSHPASCCARVWIRASWALAFIVYG